MRTHFYKFILILVAIFSFGVNAAKASLIVYVDVTCKNNSSDHAPEGYNSNMYIHYYLPDGDKPSYYVRIQESNKRVVKGRDVYRVVLNQHASYGYNDNLQWRWYVCRNDGNEYGHKHLDTLYHKSNYYVVKGWLYNKETKTGGVGYRTPGLVTGGHIYFDNSRTKWTGNIQFVIGHGGQMRTYKLTKVDNTELYYVNLTDELSKQNWGINHSYYSFIANDTAWKDTLHIAPERVDRSDGYTENYRRKGELLDGTTYFMRPNWDGKQWSFDIRSGLQPKYTIYQRAMIRPTNGAYSAIEDGDNWPAKITIQRVDSIVGATQATSSQSNQMQKNGNARALIAGEITHTYSNLNLDAYSFDGWGSEPSTTGVPTLTAPSTANAGLTHYISENTTVCAFFTAKSFKVTLNNQSATYSGTESVNPSYGYAMPQITPPTRTGYTFGGYYTATNGGGTQYYKADGTSAKNYDLTSTLTLYAKWTKNTYTVTLDNQGATSAGTTRVTATYDSSMPSITSPTRIGYTFGGYYTETNGGGTHYYYSTGSGVRNWNIASNTTLYAKWTANTYDITLNQNGGSGGTTKVTATYDSSTLSSDITNPTQTGYTFAGWYSVQDGGVMVIDASGKLQANRSGFTNADSKWSATSNKTLYAKWTANTYTVMLDNQSATSAGTTRVTATYASAMPQITPPTRTGYTFGGYYTETNGVGTQYYHGTGTSARNWNIASNNTTLYAKWTANKYTVNFNANGGSGTMENQQFTYDAAQNLTTNAFTRTGYTFAGWNTNKNGTGTSYTDGQSVENLKDNNNGSLTLYAQWTCVAPTNVKISGNYIVFPGETIELTVSGNNIAADATYVWKKGNQVIPGQTTATLTIPNCVAANAGNYSCTVTNGTCSASKNFTIKMYRLRGLTDPIDNWTADFVFTKSEGTTATHLIELDGNSSYQFNVYDGNAYYGNTGGNPIMTSTNCTGWTMQENLGNNVTIETTMAGIYTFTLNYDNASNPTISVTYPSKKIVYLNPTIWNTEGSEEVYTVYAWNSISDNKAYIPMVLADCNGDVYKAEIDAAYDRVIFIRDDEVADNLENRLNQTVEIQIEATTMQYTIAGLETDAISKKSYGFWEKYIPYYNISYNMNTNEVDSLEDVCIQNLSMWTAPQNPIRIGYTFLGWRRPANTNDDTLYKYGQSFTPKADEQLTAQWQLDEFTVTWKLGGSDYATDVVSVVNPLMNNIPQNPADDALGCCADAFMGWSTTNNPKEDEVFDASMPHELPSITQNTTFHAVFATRTAGVGTSTLNFGDMGYADKETISSITLGDGQGSGDATITLAQGASLRNDPKYYIIGNALRAYAGNTITINATYPNTVIRKVTFTFGDGDGTNEITANSGTYVDGIWTENVESPTNNLILTIGGSTGHRRIASISVTTGINGNEYTNYVTQCPNLGAPTLGEPTIDKTSIDVRCNTISSMKSAAKITLPSAADLTCPITVTASDGFLISTDQNASAKYTSSLTISPKKSDPNKGTIAKTVYVRADATSRNATYDGSITITKTEGGEETKTISITANVNCRQYVFTTVDHLGRAISTTENFANDIIANAPNAPEPDACSTSYTFAGWSMTEVAYGSPSFTLVTFPFVMPAEDVTLYPVYICNSDYHRVTSDLGANNWAGDYLIAYSDHIFADGRFGGTGDAAIGKANVQAEDFSTAIVNDVVPADPYGKRYHVTLESVEGGYVLKTQDGKYNYYTTNSSNDISVSDNQSTAAKYALNVVFESKDDIRLSLSGNAAGSVFRYGCTRGNCFFRFYEDCGGNPIYLYKKYLYTSSLICEEITAEDAMVTSTADQTIKVNVTATMSNMTVDRERELTVKSDNSDFDATIVPTTNANEYNVAVCYKPAAEDINDGTETANITIKVNNNPVTTFQVTGRHLPANFLIAAKWGDNWYALPANIDSESSKEGLLIEVDNPADPTKAIAAPNNTQYSLKSVKLGNFDSQGERLVFVGSAGKTLYNAEGTSIQVYAQYENYDDDRYEWIPTTDLKDYTLTSAHVYTDEEPRTISLDNYGVFGTLLQNKSYNGQVRLLPVDNFYEPAVLKVVEWKTNSVSIMYAGEATKATTRVSDNTESDVQLLSDKNIDHVVYNLSTYDLTTATNKPLIITLQDNEGNTVAATTLTIPAIVTGEKNTTSLVASNDIAKATSVVVLDGATLTADATKYTYDDMVVYPGGKLVINDGTKLGMYTLTLRLGSSWGATEYEHKYPEFVLNTTVDGAYSNTSGKINLDYVTTKEQYYTFVAPFVVNTKTIKYPVDIYGSNVKPDNTGSFEFQYYDGAARAEGNTGWTVVQEDPTNGAILTPGKGYTFLGMPKKINGTRQKYGIHRIPMSISAEDAMLHETREQSVSIAAHPALKNNNSGWNLIGNPYMQLVKGIDNNAIQVGNLVKIMNANGTWTGGWHWDDEDPVTAERYLVFPSNDGLSYTAVQTQNAELPAFKNFFVQIKNEAGTEMTIPNPNQQVQPALQAPAYHDGEAIETDVEVAIVLEQDEKHTDQLDLLINKAYTADFDRDADFTKMMNATQLNLFGVHWDNLSFIAIDQQTAQQSIPIGYQVPDAGEYTLRMSDKPYLMWDKIEALYLTDHEMEPEVTTDIMQQPYLFHVGKAETNHTRFTLSIIRKAESENQTPTHIDTQVAERKWSCKFIYQNKIYILHDGVIYDMMGKQIRTINK